MSNPPALIAHLSVVARLIESSTCDAVSCGVDNNPAQVAASRYFRGTGVPMIFAAGSRGRRSWLRICTGQRRPVHRLRLPGHAQRWDQRAAEAMGSERKTGDVMRRGRLSRGGRKWRPCEKRLPDGSYLSRIYASQQDQRRQRYGIVVRVIEYHLEGVKG